MTTDTKRKPPVKSPKKSASNKQGRGKKITYVIPKSLLQKMRLTIADDGYGFHQKSTWINEALTYLFQRKGWLDEVKSYIEPTKSDVTDTVVLAVDLANELHSKNLKVLEDEPGLSKGARSAILRAAIAGRVLGLEKLHFQSLENST